MMRGVQRGHPSVMIRSGDMRAARMKSRSDFILADLPPVSEAKGKSVQGAAWEGDEIPLPEASQLS